MRHETKESRVCEGGTVTSERKGGLWRMRRAELVTGVLLLFFESSLRAVKG